MALSRKASSATNNKQSDIAIRLMHASIIDAERSNVDANTLSSLRCKLSEIYFECNRRDEALDQAKRTLIALKVIDWRQKFTQLRLLEVERGCLVSLTKLNDARKVSEKMNRLDDELIDQHAPETVKRRVRTVQLDFGLGHFDRVVAEANRLKPDMKYILTDRDPFAYQLLVYLGISLIKAGDGDLGRRYLRCAAKIEEETEKQPVPKFVPDVIKAMNNRDEINELLNQKSNGV